MLVVVKADRKLNSMVSFDDERGILFNVLVMTCTMPSARAYTLAV